MDFIPVLFICLALSYFFSYIFRRIGLPHVLGHLTTGLIISLPVVQHYLFSDPSAKGIFQYLANLGLIFMLFFIGLKINLVGLLRFSRRSVNISFLSAVVPFFLGFICAKLVGLDYIGAIILGACLAITAEAVSGAILEELHMINTRIGLIIIEAGIIDDIFEILTLAVIGTIIQSQSAVIEELSGLGGIVFDILLFIGLIYVVRFVFIPVTFRILGKSPSHSDLFTASFIVVLFMAAVSNALELGTVIGALIAGVIVKQTLLHQKKLREEVQITDMIETVTFGFLEPVFFVWIAYTANIWGNLSSNIHFLPMAFFITAVASGGKILGAITGNMLDGGSLREGIIIGWGINARGAVELIAAKMAFDHMLISSTIYSSIVFMAFCTTIISPVIFKQIVRYHSKKYMRSV